MFLFIPCRPGAAEKLLAAVLLALVFLTPNPSRAQTAPGVAPVFAGPEEIYTVRNVAVDERADTASAARDVALASARRLAFNRLVRRIVLPEDQARLPLASDEALANLIADFEVAGEKSSGQRYLAQLTIRFDPDKIRALMRQGAIRHSESVAAPVLIVAVYDGPAGRLLWEENGWRDALGAAITQTGAADDRLAPMRLPLGDLEDVAALSPDQAVQGDAQSLGVMMRRYGADSVLLMQAVQSNSQILGAAAAFDVTQRRIGAEDEAMQVERFEAAAGEAPQSVLQRAALTLVRAYQDGWLSQTALDSAQQASLEIAVPVDSLPGWLDLQKRLQATPMIQQIELLALSVNEAKVNLHYLGTPEKLVSALSQHGLALAQETGRWQLRRRE